jgi:hypothetical protein
MSLNEKGMVVTFKYTDCDGWPAMARVPNDTIREIMFAPYNGDDLARDKYTNNNSTLARDIHLWIYSTDRDVHVPLAPWMSIQEQDQNERSRLVETIGKKFYADLTSEIDEGYITWTLHDGEWIRTPPSIQ